MEMKATRNLEDDTIRTLYDASLNGCISTLNTLIQKNPLILNRVSLSPFSETPLHIASLLGHSEFCEILLKRKPSFASEVDSEGRCPLHLASAEGHTEVVKALLRTNPDTCLALDKDGKLPLHLAAMRGRIGAIKDLTNARPDSSRMTIKYLLLLPEIRTAANALNRSGLTALEVLERCPRDFISLKIEDILIEAGVLRCADMDTIQRPAPSGGIASQEQLNQSLRRKGWSKNVQYQGNWIEETRGTLMVVATVIATMTFQSTISPPGGVWQENTQTGGLNCTSYGICEAGTAVLAYAYAHGFLKFMAFNTISFFSSLWVLLLLISGFPLKNKVMMWVLTIAMTVAVTFMGVTYLGAQSMVTPDHILQNVYGMMEYPLAVTWSIMLSVVCLILTLRLIIWVKKKKLHKSNRMSTGIGSQSEITQFDSHTEKLLT